MTTPIFIDSCAWNYLFVHHIDLAVELPREEFALAVTSEVKIEIESIPDGKDKCPLKIYIANSFAANKVQITYVFGFATHEPDGSLSKIQTNGGFGQGTFQSKKDRAWMRRRL